MNWSESISISRPIRNVRLRAPGPGKDPEDRVREAEAAGYARGQRDAEKQLGEQMLLQRSELIELQQGVLASLQNVIPRLARDSEAALIELALEAARKVVSGIKITEKTVEAVVHDAISQVEDSSEVTVHLHADDLALLRKHKSSMLKENPEGNALRFIASPEVTRGGCLVQTRFGLLDARRETKFEQLRQSLTS